MASYCPLTLPEDVARGNIDFDTDTFYVMLVAATYTPNQSHGKRSDYTAHEVSGTGYTAGGIASAVTVTRASNVTSMAFANPSWPSAGPGWSARYAVVYKRRGGAATADEVVAVVDFGSAIASNGTTFVVQFSNALQFSTPLGV